MPYILTVKDEVIMHGEINFETNKATKIYGLKTHFFEDFIFNSLTFDNLNFKVYQKKESIKLAV